MGVNKYNYLKCIVRGCPGKDCDQRTLVRFPAGGSLLDKWCANLKISKNRLKLRSRLCSRHFEGSVLVGKRLIKNAVPTLCLGYEGAVPYSNWQCNVGRSDDRRKCSVNGCNSTDNFKLFRLPRDPIRRNAWVNNVDINVENKCVYVCEKHFNKEDIGLRRLKKGAIPLRVSPLNDIETATVPHEEDLPTESLLADDTMTYGEEGTEICEPASKTTCTSCSKFAHKERYYIKQLARRNRLYIQLKNANKQLKLYIKKITKRRRKQNRGTEITIK